MCYGVSKGCIYIGVSKGGIHVSNIKYHIKSIQSSPFHPPSNRLAGKAVQTIKSGLKKMEVDLEDNLYNFLIITLTPISDNTPFYNGRTPCYSANEA